MTGIAMTPDPDAAALAAAKEAFEGQHDPAELRDYLVVDQAGLTYVKVDHSEFGTLFTGGPTIEKAFENMTKRIHALKRERRAATPET